MKLHCLALRDHAADGLEWFDSQTPACGLASSLAGDFLRLRGRSRKRRRQLLNPEVTALPILVPNLTKNESAFAWHDLTIRSLQQQPWPNLDLGRVLGVKRPTSRQLLLFLEGHPGGAAKTTIAYHLATDLARLGYALIFFDNDAQGNATTWFGADQPGNVYCDIVDYMIDDRVPLEDITQSCKVEHITLVPSTRDMQGADFQIMDAMIQGRFQAPTDVQGNLDMLLLRRLRTIAGDWDFCIIDTPPSMGMVTRNSLIAADCLIIPVAVSHMGFEGTGSMMSFLTSLGEKNAKKIHILVQLAQSSSRKRGSVLRF
jgi:cellulose biosynthesis protein BcsQ